MPSASSASLRPISWVTIDLTLTTSSTPWDFAIDATIALASAASLRPVHGGAVGGQRRLEQLELVAEVAQRRLLDARARGPELLPVGVLVDLVHEALPLGADGAGGVREVVPQLGVAERLVRGDGELRHPDEGGPSHSVAARISARCTLRTPDC